MPRAVRPPVIASPTCVVISADPFATARMMLALTPTPPWKSSPRYRPGARADQQDRRHRVRVQVLPSEAGEHQLDAAAAQLGEVLPDRRQRWGEVRRLGQVVEADD